MPQNESGAVKRAAYNSAADLAFVAPEVMIPLVVEQIRDDLSIEHLGGLGPTEAAIARTPEGTTFVDVLTWKAKYQQVDKNVKDYDLLKWEEEVRSQLALKKGQQKKLTTDEQARVDVQLKKEAAIRANVLAVEVRLRRGIGIIQSMVTGPPTEADLWFGQALQCLLGIILAGSAFIVGDAAARVYLVCANLVSPRLGVIRPFIGVATLRTLGSHLPREMEEEPLGGTLFNSYRAMSLY